jgi:type IV pilus assembly protein PilY1
MIMLKEREKNLGNASSLTRKLGLGLASGLLALSVSQAYAAPGVLAQLPLFLATPVQPNIFFLLDDSGSMNWEVLRRSDGGSGSTYLDYTPDYNNEERDHCVGFNVLAYDPTKTYTPWYGLDTDGAAMTDQDPTAARVNPYTGDGSASACQQDGGRIYNTNGVTCNLVSGFGDGRGAWYVPWEDDGDGEYDTGECSTLDSKRVYVSTLSADQQINFANWFSYYRKREYVMKRAVSEIVDGSTERMGFGTINRNNHVVNTSDEVGTPVRDIDDLSIPINATAVANKATLLDNLLGVNSNSGTPLRLGLQRTGEYFKGVTADTTALFGENPPNDPDSAYGESPILKADLGGTCQQNFAIVMSDGYWNGVPPTVGNTDSDGAGIFDGYSYADSWSNTLADVAMKYYEGDLLSLDNEVPIVPIPVASGDTTECDAVLPVNAHLHPNCYDTNTAQHLVTYTVAFGVRGSIPETNSSGDACLPTSRSGTSWPSGCPSGWPWPDDDKPETVDDMMHAAWNGRGLFLSAKNPAELISSLQNAIDDIASKNPVSASAVAVDSASIISGGEVVQGKFDSSSWSGELYSHSITSDGVIASSPTWEAHEVLDARGYSTRIAVTYNGTKGMAFDFPADYTNDANFGTTEISQKQVDDLMFNAPYPVTTTDTTEIAENQAFGEKLVDYLKGDSTHEGRTVGKLRDRDGHKLGDIVHSSPVYVGDPDPTLYVDATYQVWANNTVGTGGAKGRKKVIYVGANDGGLHAFDAETGEEIFVYFPQGVFNDDTRWGLHYLADRGYEHRYYVDGDITVAEVYGNFDGTGDKWSTILVGMLRGGGRSMFALDVSDPTEFTTSAGVASNILWEFSDTELGFTYSKATISKMNNGRWAAVFGNGYYPDDTATGQAALFIKYLDSASPTHQIISTGVGTNTASDCLDPTSNCNGLSTPAVVDLGGDYVADRAYAGDLLGNMWVFDLSSSNSAHWGVALGGSPLFTAKDSLGAVQPITTQPAAVLHPVERHSSTSPNTMIFFGTGQYLAESDVVSTATQSFYSVWDSGSPISVARSSALVEQTITADTLGGIEVRLMSNNPVDYSTHFGWFVDLPDSGERVVSRPIALGSIVLFNTIVPAPSLCSSSGGYSWTMVHNLIDGSEPDFIAYDVNGDNTFDSSDQVDGKNVTGKKSDHLRWIMTMVSAGNNQYYNITPEADKSVEKHQDEPSVGQRSSWGRYHME